MTDSDDQGRAKPVDRLRQVFDWHTWVTIAAVMMIAYIGWIGYSAVQSNEQRGKQISALVEQAEITARDARIEDRREAKERDVMLRNQKRMVRLNKRLFSRQQAIFQYLNDQGIEVPKAILRGNDVDARLLNEETYTPSPRD